MKGRILAVNVATPRTITIKGREVSTGIFKAPVLGPQRVEAQGVVGDCRVEPRKYGELNHAVHVYSHTHYLHWQERFELPPLALGHFGENVTVEGLVETEVRIGDVIRFGSALLQVTQPRIPCRKLDARMGFKFMRTFLESRRVGYYLRVLEPGYVQAGDDVERIDSDPESPTVDTFLRVSKFDYWDAEGLETLVRARDLPEEWRCVVADQLKRAKAASGWFGARPLEVVAREEECDGVVSFMLRCAYGRPLPPFEAGQHLTLMVKTPDGVSREARRSYAISSDPAQHDTYRITVKRQPAPTPDVPEGVVSSRFVREVAPGDVFKAAAPRGAFTFVDLPEDCDRLYMIGYNVGVAPLVSLAHRWAQGFRRIPLVFVHVPGGCAYRGLREEIDALERAHDTLRVHRLSATLTSPAEAGEALSSAPLSELTPPSPTCAVFLAGPGPFIEPVRYGFYAGGVESTRVKFARF